jgi:hypothetical protein
MKKYHIILIVLLGMFLMPSTAIACGKGSEKLLAKKKFHPINQKKRVVAVVIIQRAKTTKVVKEIAVIQNVDVLQRVQLPQ